MLEAKVHSQLRTFLRNQQDSAWNHHLTMARMVARGLRLKRSTIIQTGVSHEEYLPSYITPALLCDSPVMIVTDKQRQKKLIENDLYFFQKSLNIGLSIENKNEINIVNKPNLLVVDYQTWLDKTYSHSLNSSSSIIVTNAEKLPNIISDYLTQEIISQQWYQLVIDFPQHQDILRDKLAKLTQLIYAHPRNRDDSYLLDEEEIIVINQICELVKTVGDNNSAGQKFLDFQSKLLSYPNYVGYFKIDRNQPSFSLNVSPLELKSSINKIWQNNNFVLIANYLEPEKYPVDYGDKLGIDLEEFTCLKFFPSAQKYSLKMYFTKGLPFPNNPNFLAKVNQEILALVAAIKIDHHPIVIIIDDLPLQGQITTNLAANFGTRVQLKSQKIKNNTILVCDLKFWLTHQTTIKSPQLLIIPTLPIPSLENPLVSAQVTYYKQRKKDWFRLFLLPQTIKILQRATISVRENNGVLALLDNRVNHRSYGIKILQSLEPYEKINYLDLDWLN